MSESVRVEALSILTDAGGFRRARQWMTNLVLGAGLGEDTARQLTLAINEACVHACRRAYGRSREGRIDLSAELASGWVRVTIRDWGCGDSRPSSPAARTLLEDGADVDPVRWLVDEVHEDTTPEVGTRVVMLKRCAPVGVTS